MASQPVKRRMVHDLAKLANPDELDLPPDTSVDQAAEAYLLSYMENGGRLGTLAKTLGYSRFLLQRWIHETPERLHAFTHARTLGSDAAVDEGGELLDSATRETVAVAQARAGWRKWWAGQVNPQVWGKGVGGTVVLGDLHLHALQGRGPTGAYGSRSEGYGQSSGQPPLNGSHAPEVTAGYLSEGGGRNLSQVARAELVLPLPPVSEVSESSTPTDGGAFFSGDQKNG